MGPHEVRRSAYWQTSWPQSILDYKWTIYDGPTQCFSTVHRAVACNFPSAGNFLISNSHAFFIYYKACFVTLFGQVRKKTSWVWKNRTDKNHLFVRLHLSRALFSNLNLPTKGGRGTRPANSIPRQAIPWIEVNLQLETRSHSPE